MKKVKEFIKNNIKLLIGFILGLIISVGGVYAAIVIQGSSVGYTDNYSLGATTVQGAIDKLYEKASKCSSTPFSLGNYFSLTPTFTGTYYIETTLTGYSSSQTITPSELTLWRVIDIHCDGSVDAVSEYVSSKNVYFSGITGYANFVAGLQAIAGVYRKDNYTIDTRMMGYGGQTPTLASTYAFDGTSAGAISTTTTPSPNSGIGTEYRGTASGDIGDTLYLRDYLLVSNVYKSDTTTYGSTGLKAYKVGTTTATAYWLASRFFYYGNANYFGFYGRYIYASGSVGGSSRFRGYSGSWSNCDNCGVALRPIITLKSGVTVSGGSGTKASPYTLS